MLGRATFPALLLDSAARLPAYFRCRTTEPVEGDQGCLYGRDERGDAGDNPEWPMRACVARITRSFGRQHSSRISALQVDAGINYTLVGHSERRDIFGEDEALLGAKIAHAQEVGES